jgi:hypothetical protein
VFTKLQTSTKSGSNIRDFRARQAAVPLRRYEVLFGSDRWSPDTRVVADSIVNGEWSYKTFPTVSLRPPIAWDEICSAHRSWHYHLHCWDPLMPVLATYDNSGEIKYLSFAVAIALDWIEQYPTADSKSPFAWYDMAIGMRAYRLAFLLDVVARQDEFDDFAVASILESVKLHASVLSDDKRFAAHSNHGFYFAAGQLALAKRFPTLPGMLDAEKQAQERLFRILRTQFSDEGVHREHSTDYHRMILETFQGLIDAGLITEEGLKSLSKSCFEALAWFVLPNGRLTMFGDSPHRLMTSNRFEHLPSEALRFVVSGGKSGKPPADSVRAFPASGYIIIRNGWPNGTNDFSKWSYLAQTCAFHSRVHKHADDLSFIWYDRGHELLTDAGRYGYIGRTAPGSELRKEGFWYSDPNRIYVESTRAHNTVEIDERSFPRVGVKPYGSALLRWGESKGIHYTESHVRHWKSIRHARVLLFRPAEWLIVFDWLWDNKKEPHSFTQRFLFAPELEAARDEPNLTLKITGSADRLYMVPLLPAETVEPVKGQTEPHLLGWISRQDNEMLPCWTAGYTASNKSTHAFATLFLLGDQSPIPLLERGNVNNSGRKANFSWQHASLRHTVMFSRPQEGPFTLDYRIAKVSA